MASKSHRINIIIGARNQARAALNAVRAEFGMLGDAAGRVNTTLMEIDAAFRILTTTVQTFGQVLQAIYDAPARFEQGMAEVKAVTNATGKEFEMLRAKALELGASTRFTAVEAAEGMKFLGMAGMKTTEIVAAIGPALDLATVSGMDLGRTADILSNIMTGFGLAASEAAIAANALAVVATNSNTNIEQLGEAMKYAATAAHAAGASIFTTAAAIGTLGDAGIQASMAGTNVRGIMATLAKPTKEAKDKFAEMNVEIATLGDGSIDMIETLSRLRDANMNLADAAAIFDRRMAGGALALAANIEKLKALEDQSQSNTNALQDMREVMEATLMGAITRLTSAVEGFRITFGQHLVGAATAFVDAITAVVSAVTTLAQTFPTLTAIMTNFFAYLVLLPAAIGAVIAVLFGLSAAMMGVIKNTIAKTAVDALQARGAEVTVINILREMKARIANAMAIAEETASTAANTAAKGANAVASTAAGVASTTSGGAAAASGGKWGILGNIVMTVTNVVVGFGKHIATAGRWLAAKGVIGILTAAFNGLRTALVLLVGASGATVAVIAAIGGAVAWGLSRELTGAGAVIREQSRTIDKFTAVAERAKEELKELEKEFVDASGTTRQVKFYSRSLADLSKMEKPELERYAQMLELKRKIADADLEVLYAQMKDPSKSDAEIKLLKAKAKGLVNVQKQYDNAKRALDRYNKGERAVNPQEKVKDEIKAMDELIKKSQEKSKMAIEYARSEAKEKEGLLDTELQAKKAAIAKEFQSDIQQKAAIAALEEEYSAKRIEGMLAEYEKLKEIKDAEYQYERDLIQKRIEEMEKALEENKKLSKEQRTTIEKDLKEQTERLDKLDKEHNQNTITEARKTAGEIDKALKDQYKKRADYVDKIQELQQKARENEDETGQALRRMQIAAASDYDQLGMKLDDARAKLDEAAKLLPKFPERAAQLAKEARSEFASLAQDVKGLENNLRANTVLVAETLANISQANLKGTAKYKAEVANVIDMVKRARTEAEAGRTKEAEALYKQALGAARGLTGSAPEGQKRKAQATARDIATTAGRELMALNKQSRDEAKALNESVSEGIQASGDVITQQIDAQIESIQKNINSLDENTKALEEMRSELERRVADTKTQEEMDESKRKERDEEKAEKKKARDEEEKAKRKGGAPPPTERTDYEKEQERIIKENAAQGKKATEAAAAVEKEWQQDVDRGAKVDEVRRKTAEEGRRAWDAAARDESDKEIVDKATRNADAGRKPSEAFSEKSGIFGTLGNYLSDAADVVDQSMGADLAGMGSLVDDVRKPQGQMEQGGTAAGADDKKESKLIDELRDYAKRIDEAIRAWSDIQIRVDKEGAWEG